MRFFDWLGKIFPPGPVGDIEFRDADFAEDEMPQWQQVLFFCLGMIGWLFSVYLFVYPELSPDFLYHFMFFSLYLLISWVLHPKPRTDNLGWFGGLMNNPFRLSDDANRFLVFLGIILYPGKIMILSVRLVFFWLRKKS